MEVSMKRGLKAVVFSGLLLPALAGAQVTEVTGQTSGGAYYKIAVPDGWQPADGLVIWNHGFSLSPVGPVNDLGPLAQVQLGEGYAVAASSYSLTGWAVFETAQDNREMVDAFEAAYGVPEQILINGASLGGIVTAQGVEVGNLGNVVGAFPFCGAVAGSRMWDGGVDLRLIYDALCGQVPGGSIPGGANGLPFPPDPNFDQIALGIAVQTCLGVEVPGFPPIVPSQDQQDRLARLLAATGLPESFVLTDMGFVTFGLADLVFDPRKLGFDQVFTNTDVVYGGGLDGTIARVSADQDARRRFFDNYTPSGKVGDVKIVSMHTDKDGLVIVENETDYASKVPAGNLTVAIVVEDEPSHCGFTPAELIAGWESLRGWVAGAPQPTAAALQGVCQLVATNPQSPGPCRIDPGFVLQPLNDLVRPRTDCVPDGQTLCLDDGRFRARVDWKDFAGNTGNGKVSQILTGETGSFWFFDPDNIELVVKALDGRQFNSHLWIFYGSLTNVQFELTVTDTESGLQKVYSNPLGDFASVGDTEAF